MAQPLPWVPSEAVFGTVLKEPGTLQGYVSNSTHLISHKSSHRRVNFQGERFTGALSVIKSRAPVTGGNFGVWGGMFSTFDCAIKGWRQKEDAWNAITSGFLTGGCLAARSAFFFFFFLWRQRFIQTLSTLRWSKGCSRLSSGLRHSAGCVRRCWSLGFQDHE